MLGWEFPPYFAGGVGTVCYELTRGLARQGVGVTYVMPKGPENVHAKHVKLMVASRTCKELGITVHKVGSLLAPYTSRTLYGWRSLGIARGLLGNVNEGKLYGKDLRIEMERFAQACLLIAEQEPFDLIHAHDWTTIPAALALKEATGKPLIVHVHITEFDKTGGEHADSDIYAIEREGFHKADRVIAISNFVKRRLIRSYGVPPDKIIVIHNTVDGKNVVQRQERLEGTDKIVLFLGRVTLQKGPDYFLEAAARVAQIVPEAKFIMAGTGDMLPRMIERAADLGIGNRVIFTGFVSREQGDRLYRMADVFVMPSVSEPFGIVPLEAMRQGTPVIISRQSGVTEVITHALRVDFWDVDALASKIIAALSYETLYDTMREHTTMEVQSFTWDNPARECKHLYEELTA